MAVYTHITETELKGFLKNYDLPPLTHFSGIKAGVQNSNYLLVLGAKKYILTLYEDRPNGVNRKDLPYFLQLKQFLAARGIACPLPIAQRGGALHGELAARPAALVGFLEGRSSKSPTPTHCRAVGKAMGAFHQAGQDFPKSRRNAHGHTTWESLFKKCRAEADSIAPGLEQTIEAELHRLLKDWPSDLPQGVIHADLFPDNVFFQNGAVSGLIDFYFACTDFFAYDLAIALNAWCFEADASFNITKARGLLDGYTHARHLGAEETRALPVLAGGAAMRFLVTRLYDWLNPPLNQLSDAPSADLIVPKNPMDYLRRLRFHKSAKSAADYGLEL